MQSQRFCILVILAILAGSGVATSQHKTQVSVWHSKDEFNLEDPLVEAQRRLAVKEIRRYIYATTGVLADLNQDKDDFSLLFEWLEDSRAEGEAVVLCTRSQGPLVEGLLSIAEGRGRAQQASDLSAAKSLMQAQGPSESTLHHALLTISLGPSLRVRLIAVTDPRDAKAAVYRWVSHALGVRFYLAGDSLPDPQLRQRAGEGFTLNDARGVIAGPPLFEHRGLQPFHDFGSGPDWWSADAYKAVFGQMSKLNMNFLGLHTYPYNRTYGPSPVPAGRNEPTVWVGTAGQLDAQGRLLPGSGYPSSYASSLRENWGQVPRNTSSYYGGFSQLFEEDCFGSPVQKGQCPLPSTAAGDIQVLEAAADLLRDAFDFAAAVGVRTCVGTETPLSKPPAPSPGATTQDYYEGIFTRLQKLLPSLGAYWVWTPEAWEWQAVNASNPVFTRAVDDLKAAAAAKVAVGAEFDLLTNGWVVGPLPDRTILDQVLPPSFAAITSIDMDTGHSPVDPSYANISRHAKWAIPWMEDDPSLTAPQLWVNRTLQHMEDAHTYGCTGLLGIHWRTKAVGPQISAMARKSWEPALTSQAFWQDFVYTEFGLSDANAAAAAAIFMSIDSFAMPLPVTWLNGPGKMQPDSSQCGKRHTAYGFVDSLAKLQSSVAGPVYGARFSYWLSTFRYMRLMASTQCLWARYDSAVAAVLAAPVPQQQALAQKMALPAREALVANASGMLWHLAQAVATPGELGTAFNLHGSSLYAAIDNRTAQLQRLLQVQQLPAPAELPAGYVDGPARLINPSVRSLVGPRASLPLRALLLAPSSDVGAGEAAACGVEAFARPLGESNFTSFVMKPLGRGVSEGGISPFFSKGEQQDFEYYLQAAFGPMCASQVVWPAGAPAVLQSVVVIP